MADNKEVWENIYRGGRTQCYPWGRRGEESFYSRRMLKDSELDVNKSIREQFNLLRVADNNKYSAFFSYKWKKIYHKNI